MQFLREKGIWMRLLFVASAIVLLAGGANAADLARRTAALPLPVASGFNWTGAYVGLQGGYAWGHSESSYDDPLATGFFNTIAIDPMTPAGWYGGAVAGVNYQLGNGFVFGVEADVSGGNVNDTIHDLAAELANHGANNTITSKTDLSGTLRGRLGQSFDRTLFYATGGLAWAHSTVSATDGNLSDDATLLGWTAGVGVEQAVSGNISVKLEYLYSGFGDHTWFEGKAWQSTGSSSSNTVRAGINLHF